MAEFRPDAGITEGEPPGRPFNIKNMPVEATAVVRRYALMRGETQAEWIARAVYRQAAMEAGDEVIPPLAQASPRAAEGPPAPGIDLTALAHMVTALTASYEAAGMPVPTTLPRAAHRVLRQAIARAIGKPAGKTTPQIGMTGALKPAIDADPGAEPGITKGVPA